MGFPSEVHVCRQSRWERTNSPGLLSLYTVPYDQVSFSCLYSTPNVDVRHKAGIRIDSLDPLIHRFPDGPESADLSVDALEMMD